MSSHLDSILDGLVTGLADLVQEDGSILDPLTATQTPSDHYALTSAALALYLRAPESPGWRKALDAWLTLPPEQLGHEPFNRFLLLLLTDAGSQENVDLGSALSRCSLARSYPSNNWMLLAQLCRVLEAAPGPGREPAARELLVMLDRWSTQTGGFIDYPARPNADGWGATPMAYHHKALFVATVAAWHVDLPELQERVSKLLDWVLLSWDGAGYVGGFGRSTHALFGDACLVASLVLLGFGDERRSQTPAGRMLNAILKRWSSQRREDGLIWLNPAGHQGERPGWDNYMYLSVYNAWTAGIVSWSRHVLHHYPRPDHLADFAGLSEPGSLVQDSEAGLVRYRSNTGMVAMISTRGQPPQAFSRSEVEFRYAGGMPFHVTWHGRVLCSPSVRVARKKLLERPALAGWTPMFKAGDALYGLTDFDSVEVVQDADGLRITLLGKPRQLLRANDSSLIQRAASVLDWRVLGGALGRKEALKRRVFNDIDARLVISIRSDRPELVYELSIDHHGKNSVAWLNPGAHALVSSGLGFRRELDLDLGPATAAKSLEDSPEDQLVECPLDCSLPDAMGYCLPVVEIGPGRVSHRLTLTWSPSMPSIPPLRPSPALRERRA